MGTGVRKYSNSPTRKNAAKRAALTANEVREYFSYDPLTGIVTIIKQRGTALPGDIAGFIGGQGYREVKVHGVKYSMGRIIWLWMTGDWPDDEVDHKNTKRDDDRWENLRDSNRSQNCANKAGFYKPNKFGFRGVKKQTSGKFQAVICVKQKEYYLGQYDTVEKAAMAYDQAAKKHHGEFARFNFPETAHRNWLIV